VADPVTARPGDRGKAAVSVPPGLSVWDIPRGCVCDWDLTGKPLRWRQVTVKGTCPVHGQPAPPSPEDAVAELLKGAAV